MTRYSAIAVDVVADTDVGEGWVVFQWPHETYGHEELMIDLDGHCSRRMPIHSGSGYFEFLELRRDGIRIKFDPELARKLQLDEQIEIQFSLADAAFEELCRVVDYLGGTNDAGQA